MPKLPSDKFTKLRQSFEKYDTDKSGYICFKELAEAMSQSGLNPTKAEVEEIIAVSDKNHDGKLDFKEYITLAGPLLENMERLNNELRQVFEKFDEDKDGKLSILEFIKILQHMGNEPLSDSEVSKLLDDIDKDEDSNVSFNELRDRILQEILGEKEMTILGRKTKT